VPEDAVARRTPTGWRVGDEELPDLTSAMVFADLLAADLPAEEQWPVTGDAPSSQHAPAGPVAPAQPGTQDTTARDIIAQDAAGQDAQTRSAAAQGAVKQGAVPAGVTKQGAGKRSISKQGIAKQGAAAPAADAEQLKETVAQLERALTVRVRVEQAIGVLAERHRLRPRQAFELLRSASRARGARVSQTAGEVVASATNPLLRIPDELARQPEGPRERTTRRTRRKP
jgi:hypothetical protein